MTIKSKEELEALNGELASLNEEVTTVLAKRKQWMDDHMQDYARLRVGDDIYNLSTGQCLGVVSRIYRYWGSDNRDPQYDTTMDIQYEYHTGNNCFDNTSRRPVLVGREDEVFRRRPRPTDADYNARCLLD